MSKQQRKRHTRNSKRELRKRRRKKDSNRRDRSYYIRKERKAIIEKRHAMSRRYIGRYIDEEDWIDRILPDHMPKVWDKYREYKDM